MRKKFKTKKRIKFKTITYILLIIFLIIIFKFYIVKIKLIESNKKLVNGILNSIDYYSYKEQKNNNNIIDIISNYINENVFNSPINILKHQLNYDKENVEVKKVELIYEENNIPKVYIYNSHQSENYSYKYLEEYNIVPNVLMASNMFKDKLEDLKINTLVEESNILEYMNQNNLNHAGSYIASRYFLKSTMEKYNSIDLYIDLHRDSADHSITHTTINGKDCAKILFVIGLEYDTYQENLKIVTEINNKIIEKYPTLTRGILKKKGAGVNGVYNQDLSSNVILIELGGYENNIDEINNTLELLAPIIGEYLNEKE